MRPEPAVDLALAREHGLSEEEYARACEALGRTPTFTELGVLSVMWSEHCSYKSSRVHLKRLPTEGPRVLQGPGENAGVVDIGDGFAVVFKMESHNHPSFIEPYQGAATGVGGILRDVFTMGARPVALLDSLRFGAPEHPKTAALLRGVVAGIAGYGNSIGVPTVGGEVQFDPAYNGNILVNVFALGVCRADRIFYGRASGVGNPIIYVGARTGRDGIHGATMASAEFSEEKEARRPTVQVGDPFKEKLLLEACLEIFAEDVLEGIQDMGAAGLTSSTVEMAGRAGNGVELDLDKVPRRARGLSPYELLLSESQERMILVARAGMEHRVLELCAKWDLDAVVVGRVTDTKRFVARATAGHDPFDGEPTADPSTVVCDLPVALLTDEAPKYTRPCLEDPRPDDRSVDTARFHFDAHRDLLELLGSVNVGSRAWVWRQYDHIVRDGTVLRPGDSDAAVVRLFCGDGDQRREKFIALSVDCNGRFCELDPREGAAMAVAECCRNVACAGAEPIGLTDCLNFGNPERPEVMAQLRDAIDGIADACRALKVPVVSGNVSLYNETLEAGGVRSVLPTPTVGVVGLLSRPEDARGSFFRGDGARVALLGMPGGGALGGSEWLVRRAGKVCGAPPAIDLEVEARLQSFLVASARLGLLLSAHDCSEGGLLVTLAECCIGRGVGARVALPWVTTPTPGALFGEDPSRVVVSMEPSRVDAVKALASEHRVPVLFLGETGGTFLRVDGVVELSVSELRRRYTRALAQLVGDG
ncbi:MAG: phosphoribosylformylglycinamidine synthase subunit PurL [Deltaproteobacteria bacterium]|nr:phosphoribosylformylglycinamidine synthase subunit PurL [Deltaproteobacteria bacterium]